MPATRHRPPASLVEDVAAGGAAHRGCRLPRVAPGAYLLALAGVAFVAVTAAGFVGTDFAHHASILFGALAVGTFEAAAIVIAYLALGRTLGIRPARSQPSPSRPSARLTGSLQPPSLRLQSGYVEVWGPGGRELRALDFDRMTVNLASNDVVVDAEGVSRVHAAFERFGDAWCVRDLGSRNGTFVNGGRIIGEHARCTPATRSSGECACCSAASTRPETAAIAEPPSLTPRA